MANMEDAIRRIKSLECPTGELETRVVEILENYNIAGFNDIRINRDEESDANGVEAYHTEIKGNKKQSFTILAKSGSDDYVVKVIDAYID